MILFQSFRFSSKYLRTVATMVTSSNTNKALIIVDVQNDFISGSLALPRNERGEDGSVVVPRINKLIQSNRFSKLVYSQDWHPPNHISFETESRTAPGVDKWPVHCVQHSRGADLHPDLLVPKVEGLIKVNKGTDPDREQYSAFNDELAKHLKENNIKEVYVVGLALDYCVRHTALDFARAGFDTTIVLNCTHSVCPRREDELKKEFHREGINLVDSLY